jgi:hypothetical protein
MKLDKSGHSIANLRDMLTRGDLTVNTQYQRSSGLWPVAARSYFIDTILEGFPFQQIYFHEYLDKGTKKVRTEIVDGQQRITTIYDFLMNKFKLGKNSSNYAGLSFDELDEEIQDRFLTYTVSCDTIRDADRTKILQMFRRMNAYTLPLTDAEKRHSEFFGAFKDFITRFLDKTELLTEWEILTPRQVVRMADAAFIADLILNFENGLISTTDKRLWQLYKKYDAEFSSSDEFGGRLDEIFTKIPLRFPALRGSFITKPAAFFALCCAMYHNAHGLPGFAEYSGLEPIGEYFSGNAEQVQSNLLSLAEAHENKDRSVHIAYVDAMAAGTNREAQRLVRVKAICAALRS